MRQKTVNLCLWTWVYNQKDQGESHVPEEICLLLCGLELGTLQNSSCASHGTVHGPCKNLPEATFIHMHDQKSVINPSTGFVASF